MKADERFTAGSPAITREIALYLAAFFATIAGSALAAELDLSWPAAIRLLAYIADAQDWTEHGSSVNGAWLTDGGKEALANLRKPEYAQ